MSPRLSILSALALLGALASPARAAAQQEVTVRATMTSSAQSVPMGQAFRLQIRVEATGARIDRVELPNLDAFEVISQQVSRPMQFSFGFGGRRQQVQATQVNEMILRPIRGGHIELAPVRVTAGGRKFLSNPLTVQVTGGGAAAPVTSLPPGDTSGVDPGSDGARFDPSGFLRTAVTPASPHIGQQTTLSLYLYSPRPLRASPELTRQLTATGFWTHDLLPASRRIEAEVETVRGQRFHRYLLYQSAAFPLRSGELTIGAAEVRMRSGSILGLGGGQQRVYAGVPTMIEVQALPDGAPADTVVGSYRLHAELDHENVRTGDAITLTATVTGDGNLRDIRPALAPLDGVRVLEPRVEDESVVRGSRLMSTRRIEWLVIVERPGSYTLPRIAFHRLDPANGVISEIGAGPFTIEAVGPEAAAAPAETPVGDPEANEPTGGASLQLGPIRTQSALARHRIPLIEQTPFRWGLALPPMAFLALLLFFFGRRVHEARAEGDPGGRSAVAARKAIRRAGAIDGSKDPAGFYGEISHALKTALEGKLGEPVGGLTYIQLRRDLLIRDMDSDLIDRVVDELESCDFARFSAVGTSDDELERALKRASALVTRIAGAALDSGGAS